jgi:hypothetical protein
MPYDETKALRGLSDRQDHWSAIVHDRTPKRVIGDLYNNGSLYRADFNVEVDKEGRFSVSLHRVKNSQVRFKLGEYVVPMKPPEPSAAR